MAAVAFENNRDFFYTADFISSCDLQLVVKTKAASCKCLFDESFFKIPYICLFR